MSDVEVESIQQTIIVNSYEQALSVEASTQMIVVNPATQSVGVINAGPPGPQGATGDSDLDSVLTVDGQLLTRETGVLAPITRANLAMDQAFTSRYVVVINHGSVAGTARKGTAPTLWIGSVNPTNATNDDELFRTDTVTLSKRVAGVWVVVSGSVFVGNDPPPTPTDGKLWWDTDDVLASQTLDPTALANDSAFTSKYTTTVYHGSTAAIPRKGTAPCQWIGTVNPTNAVDDDRLYRIDQTALYVRVAGAWVEVGSARYVPVPTPWVTMTPLTSSWVAYDAGHLPQYRKEGDRVFLRGLVKSGTTGVMFVLPAGFRPSQTDNTFAVLMSGGMGNVSVNNGGNVTITGSATFTYLDGVSFSTVA